MKKLILATAAALTIVSSGALAQGSQTAGRIVKIDEPNGKITLQHLQPGTVGSVGANLPSDTYRTQPGLSLKELKAGDQVIFNEVQIGGVWTVTQIQKR